MTPQRTDKSYLNWLKKQPCSNPDCKGNGGQMIPAHQRILGNGGMGLKSPDRDALPLCFTCHSVEHRGSITFWAQGSKAATKKYVQEICNYHLERYRCEKYS